MISGLDYSSAVLSAMPEARDAHGEPLITEVIHVSTSRSPERCRSTKCAVASRPSARYVRELTGLIGRGIREVRFESHEDEVAFVAGAGGGAAAETLRAYGRAQALQARKTLRFALYDLVHDKANRASSGPVPKASYTRRLGSGRRGDRLVSRDARAALPRSGREWATCGPIDAEHLMGRFSEAEGAVTQVLEAPPSKAIIRNLAGCRLNRTSMRTSSSPS